jgi:hypothetical protein
MGGGKGARRLVAGGLVGVALIAAVGLASRARTPAGGGHPRTISHDVLLEYLLLLFAGLAVVVVPITVYLIVAGREEMRSSLPVRRNWTVPVLISTIVVSGLAVLVVRYLHDHHGARDKAVGRLTGLARHGSETVAVRFDWGPVIVVTILAATALAAAAWYVIERRRAEPSAELAAPELALALERTLVDLRAEPDPRKAVIAAYAQMERAFADAELPRRPAEAPREYLGRVLPAVGASTASAERLTALFERAKFSPHTIDATMKEEAIDALESLRDELRSAS